MCRYQEVSFAEETLLSLHWQTVKRYIFCRAEWPIQPDLSQFLRYETTTSKFLTLPTCYPTPPVSPTPQPEIH